MLYCTADDVIRELPLITINAETKPSTAEVDQFCTDIDAEMNARMRGVGIITPVADPNALAVLKPIAINAVKAKVLRAKKAETADAELASVYEQLYQDAMGRIEKNPAIVRENDSPGMPQGAARLDADIPFTRRGSEW